MICLIEERNLVRASKIEDILYESYSKQFNINYNYYKLHYHRPFTAARGGEGKGKR